MRQADDLITIRQLRGKFLTGSSPFSRGVNSSPSSVGKAQDADAVDEDEADLDRAVGHKAKDSINSRLNRVYQLTGFADPVYAEAHLTGTFRLYFPVRFVELSHPAFLVV